MEVGGVRRAKTAVILKPLLLSSNLWKMRTAALQAAGTVGLEAREFHVKRSNLTCEPTNTEAREVR
jgi:hypothetical protein